MKNTSTPTKRKPSSKTRRKEASLKPMLADEFCELVHAVTNAELAEYYGVDERTIRHWKAGDARIPGAVARLTRMRYTDDASALLGKDWEYYRFGSDGKLYVPGWRGGFDAHQIKAMFFRTQLVGHHEASVRALEKRIVELERDVIEANEAAARYRNMVSREARFGLMLERVVG